MKQNHNIKKEFLIVRMFLLMSFSFIFTSINYSKEKESIKYKAVTYVNKQAFDDSKNGIITLTKAYDALEMLDCFPSPCDNKTHELWSKKLANPILNEISISLKRFEIENNILILDAVELNKNRLVLAVDERFDITKQFIKYFNDKSGTSGESFELPVLSNKIATINSTNFFDKENGISNLIKAKKVCDLNDFSEINECSKIGNAITSFAERNNFSFIFDSGKELPEVVNKYQTTDVTQQFISEYNKNN